MNRLAEINKVNENETNTSAQPHTIHKVDKTFKSKSKNIYNEVLPPAKCKQEISANALIEITLTDIERDTAHKAQTKGESTWMIHPTDKKHIIWDMVIAALLMYTLVALPLILAFPVALDALSIYNLFVDGMFMLDVVKNFITGSIKDDMYVLDFKQNAYNYLQTWFLTDFVSSIPFDAFYDSSMSRSSKGLKLLRLLRLAKLLRLVRISRIVKYMRILRRRIEDNFKFRIPTNVLRFSKLFLVSFIGAHWAACMQWMVVRLHDFPPESWAALAGLDHAPLSAAYAWSLLKTVGTLLNVFGFETLTPVVATSCISRSDWCTLETWMTLCLCSLGHIFYAVLIAEMNAIVSMMNRQRREFDAQVSEVNAYMLAKKLPHSIKDKVRDYFIIMHKSREIFDEAAILDRLSPAIRKDIMAYNAQDLLVRVPILNEKGSLQKLLHQTCAR